MPSPSSPSSDPFSLNRRSFLKSGVAAGALTASGATLGAACAPAAPPVDPSRAAPPAFALDEITVDELQRRMASGALTAVSITEQYLGRIAAVNREGPNLRAVLETNPDALAEAARLDQERKDGQVRGPLHGIPILIKGNIATADRMTTTAGSLALEGVIAPADAFLVSRLREAGAILLGKSNLSEWANFRSTRSSSGWSGIGGQCRNPYALDRNTSGSSSGSGAAAAANLAAITIGTETDGSITSPSGVCGVVGIKPTLGLVSRTGIIPIAHSQDTAGPLARTVRDAAILLGAMVGTDPADAITEAAASRGVTDYTQFLDPTGLRGARIGVVRKEYSGFHPRADLVFESALEALKAGGVELVDPADIPTAGQFDEAEYEVLLYEFKADLEAYFASLGSSTSLRTMADLVAFNEANAERSMPWFGQEIIIAAAAKGPLTDPAYRTALANSKRLAGREGIDAVMDRHRLDALVAPTNAPAWPIDLINGDHYLGGSSSPAAVAGYPNITVPAGAVFGLPVGISFFGRAFSEGVLLRLAHAFEQATTRRRQPTFLRTVDLG